MAKTPFIVVPELTAIAVAYRQGNLIADRVLPYVAVNTVEFRYKKFGLADDFTVPATLVGRKGSPQQVEFGETEVTDAVEDHALDAPVPNADIEAYERARASGVTDPMMRATGQVMQLVLTAREKRVADLVFGAGNYAATTNKSTLSGTTQWSDHAQSNPQTAIMAALDGMVMRPNIAVFGRAVWTQLSTHPKINAAVYKSGTTAGVVSRQAFADLFELDEVLVGDGWINTAAKGQTPTMARIWGKHAAFLHRNMNADTQFGISFGFTARFGDRVGGYIEDPDMGMRGGRRARSGESVKELVTANDLGYLFINAVA
ncbi:MAG: major capsid protein [Burkholderiaceae bacterium]|jgi:hypothetical protein|nr:major capsid protein [Burkholderiaceae bacterium]